MPIGPNEWVGALFATLSSAAFGQPNDTARGPTTTAKVWSATTERKRVNHVCHFRRGTISRPLWEASLQA